MELVVLLAKLLIAGAFLLASISKLAARASFRQTLLAFGASTKIAPAVAIILPIAELVLAFALLVPAFAWWAALASAILLGTFTAILLFNVVRGNRVSCNCFGQLSSAPIGWNNVARTFMLSAIATIIVLAGRNRGASFLGAWPTEMSMLELVSLVASAAALSVSLMATWLALQLMAQNGRLLKRLDALEAPGSSLGPHWAPGNYSLPGLAIGTPAPDFALHDVHGRIMTLDGLLAGDKRVLLAFTDPACAPCNALLPDLATWERDLSSTISLSVISSGSLDQNVSKAEEHGLRSVLLDEAQEVSNAYLAALTPSAVMIDSDGRVASALAVGTDEIRALVASGAPYYE